LETVRFSSLLWVAPAFAVVACGARTELYDDTYSEPGIHVTPVPPAGVSDCPDPSQTLVYAIAESNALYSVYPPTFALTKIGTLDCPAASGATPFSMAVDRQGIADVVFDDGELFRVSTATAACTRVPFVPDQDGFLTFGMGYSGDADGTTETLYISADTQEGSSAMGLASVDANLVVHPIGSLSPAVGAELTGTGGGQLFGFYSHTDNMGPTFIGEIDKSTATIVAETPLPGVVQGNGWAFAFWGGDFYVFTSPNDGGSTVWRYRTSDGSLTKIATLDDLIVGAGVSTCAPEQ
jgi:hypothetical protein